MYVPPPPRRRTGLVAGIIVGGAGAALLIAGLVLVFAGAGQPKPGQFTEEDSGPIRAGVCVTGLPPGANEYSTGSYTVHRVSCSSERAQLQIDFPTTRGRCDGWLLTIDMEQFCASEIEKTGTPS